MSYYGAVERAGLIGTILARPCRVMTILGTISEGVGLRGRGTYSPVLAHLHALRADGMEANKPSMRKEYPTPRI
jgi:hypothetical protein